jgi:hypothetical protein
MGFIKVNERLYDRCRIRPSIHVVSERHDFVVAAWRNEVQQRHQGIVATVNITDSEMT